jgi:hypothetical protein
MPKHRYRLQGYVDPSTWHVLFEQHFQFWGAQGKIIYALLQALANHVSQYADPYLSASAKERYLEDLLSRVRFDEPRPAGSQQHGPRPALRAPQGNPPETARSASKATGAGIDERSHAETQEDAFA